MESYVPRAGALPVRPRRKFMRNLKLAAGAAILCSALVAGAANAASPTAAGCFDMAQQVKTALAANTQSSNYQEAMKEQNNGLSFCSESFYQYGINHYSHALTLLGVNKS
jgi:outer membrane murein-binding lipoprotein Lpp